LVQDFGTEAINGTVSNQDPQTRRGFDENWASHGARGGPPGADADAVFAAFFSIFPLGALREAEGFDLGCGFGRIARRVAPLVGRLHCIEPSPAGLAAARAAMAAMGNVEFHAATVDAIPLADGSQDFGYSLGVLHHVPDTEAGLQSCTAKLKRGAPFLLYLYYAFDNRPAWFRSLWKASELARGAISRMPFPARKRLSDVIALAAYWPLSRAARLLERRGRDVGNFPLSFYRNSSFTTLRADALDRFGTRLEQRFTRAEMKAMMRRAGLERIRFLEQAPYWTAVGYKS
jgi:SAM-dependent methyltransferase